MRAPRVLCADGGSQGDTNNGHEMDDLSLLNVHNFDQESTKEPILTSPRSLEACRMMGVEPHELIKRSLEFFISRAAHEEEPTLIAKRAARYEKNRQNQLRHVRSQRQELMDVEIHGVHGGMSLRTRSFCHSPLSAKLSMGKHNDSFYQSHHKDQRDGSVLDKERRELERIRHRQALEMQQLLTFEMKMAEIHRESEMKELEQRKQQEQVTREKLRRQREADEVKRRKDLEKAEQQRLEVERVRREAQERQHEMMTKAEQDEREKERRKREIQLCEKERVRKQEEQRLQNELYALQQQRDVERKAQEIARRDERRRQLLDHKKRQKASEITHKQQKNKMRITSVLQDRDVMRRLQLDDQQRKQMESEERRKRFEDERKRKEDEIRFQSSKKKEMIEMVQLQLHQIEQQRRERLQEQEREVENRLKAQEMDKQYQREMQKKDEQRQEDERRKVYLRMEQQIRQRQESTMSKAEQKSAIAQMVHHQKKQMIRSRLHEAKLREEEIQAALTRKQKQDHYRVDLLLSRIESDNERAKTIKEERALLVKRRQQIKRIATRQKQELLESFYKMKITKKYEIPKNLQDSLATAAVVRPQSASAAWQTRSLTKDQPAQDGPAGMGTAAAANRQANKRPPMPKRPASAAARSSSSRQVTTWRTGSPRSARPRTSRATSDCGSDLNDQELGVENDDNDGEDGLDTARQEEMEELRRKQNEELLLVLQQEHHAEEQREYLLQQVATSNDRARMEQIFNQERAQASERIMKMTQQHEEATASRLRNL